MKKIQGSIKNQIALNTGKNLFHDGAIRSMGFAPEMLSAMEHIDEIDTNTEQLLIDFLTTNVIQEFGKLNQYYSFNKQTREDLRKIYIDLFTDIKNPGTLRNLTAKKHYINLRKWLLKANSFAGELYINRDENIEAVACHEYSAILQMELLQIDTDKISLPVLDIGCGKQGNLVKHLRKIGIEAYGFDRFADADSFLFCSDWLEFGYGCKKWGTIISNLGFSNHFNHHHLRNNGQYIEYAET